MGKNVLYDELLDDGRMDDGMMPNAVARIRSKENTLLTDQDLKNLMGCKDYDESIQFLLDKGWGPTDNNTPEELIAMEKDRMWEFINSILNKRSSKLLDIFRISSDYHNLKAAIKESYIQKDVHQVYMDSGTMDVETLRGYAAEGDFDLLPADMAQAARDSREVLFRTGDSQLCEVILDRTCLNSIRKAAENSGNDLLKEYAELKCVSADINIAIRASRAGKGEDFLKEAFAESSTISVQQLINASRNGIDSVYEYLEQTSYRDAADAIKESPAAFDRWCDNKMMAMIRPQKYNAFTISPVIAYILAKENEIKSVRLILAGRLNDLPEEKIQERLRESYV